MARSPADTGDSPGSAVAAMATSRRTRARRCSWPAFISPKLHHGCCITSVTSIVMKFVAPNPVLKPTTDHHPREQLMSLEDYALNLILVAVVIRQVRGKK